jgi:hypothetical protein
MLLLLGIFQFFCLCAFHALIVIYDAQAEGFQCASRCPGLLRIHGRRHGKYLVLTSHQNNVVSEFESVELSNVLNV